MTVDVVIARYGEDCAWIEELSEQFNPIIYNKSGKTLTTNIYRDYRHVPLSNPGGNESHTYLWHIVNNYDTLSDTTVFCQAWPFDHSKDFLDKIKEPCYNFTWLAHEMLRNELDGHPHHSLDIFVDNKTEALHPDWLYCAIFHNRPPDYFIFGQGGMHMVTKEQIHTKPKEFYQHIINLITGPFKQYKPFCALERFWNSVYLDLHY